jgi:AraC-like DNA-binding protein
MIQPLRGLRGGQERYGALTGERQSPASNGLDFPGSLKLTLRSYLPEGYPDVTLAAEIAGSSVRTLQRRLMPFGLSYSHLIQQVRFEVASEMLEDSNVRMLDVARAVGYEDQSHFTRAFRRIAGVTPTEYRRQRETG